MYPKKSKREVKTTKGIRKTRNRMHYSLNRPIIYQPKNSSGAQYIPPALPEVTESDVYMIWYVLRGQTEWRLRLSAGWYLD